MNEDHPIKPISPYGISKHAVELYLNHYYENYNLDFVSLRLSNVYGPRDGIESDHVIPLFIHRLLNKKVPTISGDGNQGRDFVYVEDVVDAVVLALEKIPKDKFLNIGREKLVVVNKLFNEIKTIMKVNLNPNYKKAQKGEVKKISLNCKRAKIQLGWISETSLKEGLEKTVKWFKKNKIS